MSSRASSAAWLEVLQHPGAFALRVLKAFRKNQGLLLAGAVAYYALLSIVPLLILIVIALSHLVEQQELLETLERYLGWLVPGQSQPIIAELAGFLAHRDVIGWVLLGTLLFFSSLAFTVLENAMSIIFFHRVAVRRRHFLVSAVLPYCYILFLGVGLLVVTLVSGGLEAIGRESIDFLGLHWSLGSLLRVSSLRTRGRGRGVRARLGLPRDAGGAALRAPRAYRGGDAPRCYGRRRATFSSGTSRASVSSSWCTARSPPQSWCCSPWRSPPRCCSSARR